MDAVDQECGYSHDLIDEADGKATYECRVCGAEITDASDDDEEGNPR